MIAKISAAANLFGAVPFVLHALGPAQFGVWATLVSLMAFGGFLDFGFSFGTMNLVAAAHGRGNTAEVADIFCESRKVLFRVALWLTVGALFALPTVPWHRLLGMPEAMTSMSRATVAVVLCSIVLAVPLNLANRVQLGLGRGDRAFRWQAIGQWLTLAMVIALSKVGASLAVLTAAAVTTPLLASLANTISLRRDPVMAMTASNSPGRKSIALHIKREGALFFILQLAAALAFSVDLPLISALRGPTEAGQYAIVQRLFSIVPLGLSLIWMPLWPLYRQALAAGHHGWVLQTLRRSLLLAVVVACAVATVLGLGFNQITNLWVSTPLVVAGLMLAGFAVWSVLEAAGGALAAFLNAASIMRYQVISAISLAAICIAAKLYVLHDFTPNLLPWTTAAVYLLTTIIPLCFLFPRITRKAFADNF